MYVMFAFTVIHAVKCTKAGACAGVIPCTFQAVVRLITRTIKGNLKNMKPIYKILGPVRL